MYDKQPKNHPFFSSVAEKCPLVNFCFFGYNERMIRLKKKTPKDIYCPDTCPHLETPALRDVNSIPYYCEKFCCFLGFDEKVLRCDSCSGCSRGIQETGLALISSIRHPNLSPIHTKKAFLCMEPKEQKRLVALLLEYGPAIALTKNTVSKGTPVTWAKVLTQMLNVQEDVINHAPSPQAAVASFLGVDPGTLPGFMTRQVCQLLQNLLGILDNTERYWLREVLSSKEGSQKFAQKLKEMPKGKSFVANVRRELEDAFKKELERQKDPKRKLRIPLSIQRAEEQQRREEQLELQAILQRQKQQEHNR